MFQLLFKAGSYIHIFEKHICNTLQIQYFNRSLKNYCSILQYILLSTQKCSPLLLFASIGFLVSQNHLSYNEEFYNLAVSDYRSTFHSLCFSLFLLLVFQLSIVLHSYTNLREHIFYRHNIFFKPNLINFSVAFTYIF
jgi:hypothetical protein